MADLNQAVEHYRPTPDDRRLIEEFRQHPIGHHSADLHRLLTRLRGAAMADKHCLVTIEPNRVWQLAKTTGVPGKPLTMLKERFTTMAEAEWHVFRLRWEALTGERLSR